MKTSVYWRLKPYLKSARVNNENSAGRLSRASDSASGPSDPSMTSIFGPTGPPFFFLLGCIRVVMRSRFAKVSPGHFFLMVIVK